MSISLRQKSDIIVRIGANLVPKIGHIRSVPRNFWINMCGFREISRARIV